MVEPVDAKPHNDIDARITTAWSQDAQMEHASIASFARFTLELLAVGAPPTLLLASQDAGRDEIQHAQTCFAIASRLAGRKLGPGPLDVSGVGAARDLASIVAATVKEGCVIETLSALLAKERSEGARDPALRAALGKIADDEGRHAELAWRFLAWAIQRGGDPIRDVARGAFEESREQPIVCFHSVLRGVPSDEVRAHGLLDEATARHVTERAFVDVINPRALELLGRAATG
jgi:hypothetical protein